MTRSGFCLKCQATSAFVFLAKDWYRCPTCGSCRTLTLTRAEANHGGDEGRFWAGVKVTPFCWPWIKPCRSKLGPRFAYKGRDVKVARMAFFFSRGNWPDGGAVRTCSNPFCCRPDHIVDLLQKDVPSFMKRIGRHRAGRRPTLRRCKRGHSMEGWNAGRNSRQRFCRTCHNMMRRRMYKRRKEAAWTSS